MVRHFDADEGWDVIVAPDVPGDCFAHFSGTESSGYRELRAGQRVRFTYEEPGFLPDGCRFRYGMSGREAFPRKRDRGDDRATVTWG